jgi:hypothetical protein
LSRDKRAGPRATISRMESGGKRPRGPTCSGTTRAGKPCRAMAGADGLFTAHSGRTDMRSLGAKGGKARRAGVVEQLPEPERESLRQHLRDKLDYDVILAAVQQTLAGGNESARVQCIRFLADLELYR